MSEAIQVQMLGEFTIRYGDCVISDSNDRSHRVWSLLAYLLVNRSREFTQEELINLCWSGGTGSSDPANALKSVGLSPHPCTARPARGRTGTPAAPPPVGPVCVE